MYRLFAALILSSSLLAPSLAFADVAGDRIRALSEPPGKDAWDAKIVPIVLANYDLDGSGTINKTIEIDQIPCDTWKAMDDGVKAGWEYGLRVIYGFQPDKMWVGNAIGIDEGMRAYADAKLVSCGLDGAKAGAVTPRAPTGGGNGAAARAITNTLPGEGGSGAWDTAVLPIMVGAFDANRSGTIDTTNEVLAIPCDAISALDTRIKEKWSLGVRVVYGFETDKIWIGHALGFAEGVRSAADLRMAQCLSGGGGTSASGGGGTSASGGGGTSASGGATAGGPISQIKSFPGGGSGEWDAKVLGVLIANFDKNGSGTLDTTAEVKSLGCGVWTVIDKGVKQSYSYGVRPIYGFEKGYSWIGGALGFSETMRMEADAILQACGLME